VADDCEKHAQFGSMLFMKSLVFIGSANLKSQPEQSEKCRFLCDTSGICKDFWG